MTHLASERSWARLLTITGWGARIEWRAFLHDSLHTTQGRIMIAISVFAIIPAWQILMNGENILMAFVSEGASRSFLIGGVYIGELALLIGFALLLPIFLAKEFVVAERGSPLRSHPIALPEDAVVRVAAVILWISAFLWTSFHLFYLGLLLHPGGEKRWVGVALHILAGQLYFLPAGVLIAALTRQVILGFGGSLWVKKYYPFGIIPFLLGYSLFLYLPKVLSDRLPGWVEATGESAGSRLHLLQFPVAVWIAGTEGSWIGAAAWLLALSALTLWGGVAVWRWRRHARVELVLDDDVTARRPKPLNFHSGSVRSRWLREFRLFWIKDSQALSRRNPLRALRTHGIVSSLSLVTLIILPRRLESGAMSESLADFLLTALVVTIGGLLAMRSTLGRLGMEGSALLLLRPVLPRRRLFGLKLAAGALETALLSAGYSLAIILVAPVLGAKQLPPLYLIIEGMGWGIALAPVGAALGFLLPDFRNRGLLLHGASTPSKLLFPSVGAIPISCYLVARWLQEAGLFSGFHMAAGGVLVAALLAGMTLLLLVLALRTPSWSES